jgi:hypothetical protein
MKSNKPVKFLEDIIGDKMFNFPDELANDRFGPTNQRCICIQVNSQKMIIPTGRPTTLTLQEFSILKDAGILSSSYTYALNAEFDPIGRPYDI